MTPDDIDFLFMEQNELSRNFGETSDRFHQFVKDSVGFFSSGFFNMMQVRKNSFVCRFDARSSIYERKGYLL